MKTDRPSRKPFEPYSISFKKHVRFLIAWGYENAKSITITDKEEIITGLLYDAIKNVLRTGEKRWFQNYSVKNEDPICSRKRSGNARKEIDLIIEFTKAGRPEYIFEAKPLNHAKKYQRTGNYTNREGMGRFLEGEYADYTADYPEIGMLGYVLSDTPQIWKNRLQEAIIKKRVELQVIYSGLDAKVIDEFPLEWMSIHRRICSEQPVTIYHLLLDYRK